MTKFERETVVHGLRVVIQPSAKRFVSHVAGQHFLVAAVFRFVEWFEEKTAEFELFDVNVFRVNQRIVVSAVSRIHET
jgi:hypothetical protein